MNQLIRVALAAFACYRLAQLAAMDSGPYWVFERARRFAGRKASGIYHSQEDKRSCFWYNVAEFLNCPFCLGVWFAVPVAIAVMWPTLIGDLALLVFGIAGVQCYLEVRR